MNLDWQNVAVIVVVAVATGYLARAGWQTFSRKRAAACGGCSKCPATDAAAKLVEIGTVAPAASSSGSAATGSSASSDHEAR
jgi:hypothetical protein